MTNAQIIFNASVKLMQDGIIKGTGRVFQFEDEDGLHELEEPEALHTFATWKELGRVVKKGEKARAKIQIWKYAKSKNTDDAAEDVQKLEESDGRCFMKTAYFFTIDQTEPLKAKREA